MSISPGLIAPLQYCLFTPGLQWLSRGNLSILTGVRWPKDLAGTLGGRQAESFLKRLPEAMSACELRVSTELDKKREKQMVFQHRQALLQSVAEEGRPLDALRLAAQLLACLRHDVSTHPGGTAR